MAARGAASKEIITNKILETFKGAFQYDKEIRIPMVENGENLQIKLSLTCAKTNVEAEGDKPPFEGGEVAYDVDPSTPAKDFMNEPTEEEKTAVEDLLKKLGLG